MTFDWNKEREALLLDYDSKGQRKEAATHFGVSPDAVKTKINRLRKGIVAKPPARKPKKRAAITVRASQARSTTVRPISQNADNKSDAELIAEAIANGKVRRFETSATGDFMHLQNWLLRVHKIEVKRVTSKTTNRPFAIGKKRLDHADFYGLVNKLRAKDGKEPLVRLG